MKRMKQLKPDVIFAKYETFDYEALEKQLHKRYMNMQIPQTKYFRLNDWHLNKCRNKLTKVVIPQKAQTYTDLLDKKDQAKKEALDA